MPSDLQIQANRENARRSTGPRTPLGKARASLNAVRHGLTSHNAVLPQEDQQAYAELLASLEAQFQPQNPVETFLVQQMASAQWRIQHEEQHPQTWSGHDQPEPTPPKRPRNNVSEEDEVTRLLGVLFQKNCGMDAFARLARYENMLNAQYFRALRTLTNLRKPPSPQPGASDKTNPIPPQPGALCYDGTLPATGDEPRATSDKDNAREDLRPHPHRTEVVRALAEYARPLPGRGELRQAQVLRA